MFGSTLQDEAAANQAVVDRAAMAAVAATAARWETVAELAVALAVRVEDHGGAALAAAIQLPCRSEARTGR